MKKIILIFTALSMSACLVPLTPDEMLTLSGVPISDISAQQYPDGTKGFRFVIQDKNHQYHDNILANSLGDLKICENGYNIKSTTVVQGTIIKEGVCK